MRGERRDFGGTPNADGWVGYWTRVSLSGGHLRSFEVSWRLRVGVGECTQGVTNGCTPRVTSVRQNHVSGLVRFRHPAGEVLVPGALPRRDAGQGARLLPEAAQVLRAERAQTQAAQGQEEEVSLLSPSNTWVPFVTRQHVYIFCHTHQNQLSTAHNTELQDALQTSGQATHIHARTHTHTHTHTHTRVKTLTCCFDQRVFGHQFWSTLAVGFSVHTASWKNTNQQHSMPMLEIFYTGTNLCCAGTCSGRSRRPSSSRRRRSTGSRSDCRCAARATTCSTCSSTARYYRPPTRVCVCVCVCVCVYSFMCGPRVCRQFYKG